MVVLKFFNMLYAASPKLRLVLVLLVMGMALVARAQEQVFMLDKITEDPDKKSGTTRPAASDTFIMKLGAASGDPGSVSKNPCENDAQRWLEASCKAQMLADQLAMYENLLVELERQYENTRLYGFWCATADLSTLPVSVYWKYPTGRLLTRFFGGQATKEALVLSLTWKLMESALKGMMKESFKYLMENMAEQDINIQDALKGIGKKGAEETRKKIVVESVKVVVQDIGESRLRMVTPRPGASLSSAFGTLIRANYVKMYYSEPIGDTVNWLWSTYSMISSASDNLDKLDKLRGTINYFRDRKVIPLRQQVKQAKQDLEVARAAYDCCLKLHPEAKEGK